MANDATIDDLLGEIFDAVQALHPGFSPHIQLQRGSDGVWVSASECQNGKTAFSTTAPTARLAIEVVHREVMGKCHEIWKRVDPVVRKGAATDAPEQTGAG